ncbi:hypothetical protein [Pseudoroseicyclus tamaricis]|uniref:Uncharacterized protein n=1 Tax=Pseudoroseicyclus tamaricis TaxID=2705421 RepID=A0A6B2JQU9_9RHOB|nr:hypothetical protein [Pseudoroseicyclus tamaricis]NDV00345.1 hypothetical protein [Pseudoroseicyclus tamaricis]
MSDDRRASSSSSLWAGPIVVGVLVAMLAIGSIWYAQDSVFGEESGTLLVMPEFEEEAEETAGIDVRASDTISADLRTKQGQ